MRPKVGPVPLNHPQVACLRFCAPLLPACSTLPLNLLNTTTFQDKDSERHLEAIAIGPMVDRDRKFIPLLLLIPPQADLCPDVPTVRLERES
jgi:hypothetical protein